AVRNRVGMGPGGRGSGWIAWPPDRRVAVARFAAGVPAGGEKPAAVPTVNCMICLRGTPPRCAEFGPLGYGALALLYHWNFDPAGAPRKSTSRSARSPGATSKEAAVNGTGLLDMPPSLPIW